MNLSPSHIEIDKIMQSMLVEHRYRWCDSKACCCLGCCNRGPEGLIALGFNKADWLWWVVRHPESEKDKYGKYIKSEGDVG